MILKGKAKDAFDKWFFKYYNKDKVSVAMFNHETMFVGFQEITQNSYIIEFFKSLNVLIIIDLDQTSYPKFQCRIVKYEDFGNYETLFTDGLFSSKEESEKEAIKKANELFNENVL